MAASLRTFCLVSASLLLGLVQASPRPLSDLLEVVDSVNPINSAPSTISQHDSNVKREVGDFELRIMPLGASIMSGVGASSKDGLRRYLRGALVEDGWDVNMVGTFKSGDMIDKDHEAVPGDKIDQVRARFERAKGFKPNVIIINAGTNDANFAVDIGNAGNRMEGLLNDIWSAPDMSSTCVFLSTILPTGNENGRVNRIPINDQYRRLVQRRASEGDCIYLAEMGSTTEGVEIFHDPEDFCATYNGCDFVHPNDEGHKKMAAIFRQAINTSLRAGKLKAPGGDFESSSPICDKHEGTGRDAGGLTQRGSGADDDVYFHDSVERETPFVADSEWDRDQWRFARLFSPGYDDLVAGLDRYDPDGYDKFAVWVNQGNGTGEFDQAVSEMRVGLNCPYEYTHFLDMNADGLEDLVCIRTEGRIDISINQGDGDRLARKPPSFVAVGQEQPSGQDADTARVILGDIDGDGRGDYGVLDKATGEIRFWRNDGGVRDRPRRWQAMGVRSPPRPMVDQKGYRLEDINGDGRDDLLFVDPIGETTTWTNSRSCLKGEEGDGLNVAWRQGYYKGQGTGPTHYGVPWAITDDEDDIRGRVHFARIYGKTPVTGNLAKLDYVFMHHKKVDGKHHFEMRVWENTGYGGTKLLADGNMYCNVLGHPNGNVDYVWAWGGGQMELWASRGKDSITSNDKEGWWDYRGYMFKPDREMSRRDLHLADWDGDGRCDIIHVDPEDGSVEVFINNRDDHLPQFVSKGNPAPELGCGYRNGLGMRDISVRFADLTGNGRADYLCMDPDARTTGFVQDDDGKFHNVSQIKMPDGYERANYQWADVDGDGKDDLLWVEKFTGDGYVWYNEKQGNVGEFSGSSFLWRRQAPPDKAYAGLAAGTCEHFVDLDGNKHADIHYILGTFTNEAKTSLAPACGLVDTPPENDEYDPLPPPPNPDPVDPGNPGGPPDYCVEGNGTTAALNHLCTFTCRFGICPEPPCHCLKRRGEFPLRPADLAGPGAAAPGQDPGLVGPLCEFACRKLFCPPGVCTRAAGELSPCRDEVDLSSATSWASSGAERMLESYIEYFGEADWLTTMDKIWNSGGAIQCDVVDSPACETPGACIDFDSAEYYHIRLMANRIQTHFTFADNTLTDQTIETLGSIDSMIVDFKFEDEDNGVLSKIFGLISGGFAVGSAIATTNPAASSTMAILSTIFGSIPGDESTGVDYDSIADEAMRLLTKTFANANDGLQGTLAAIFAAENSDPKYVNDIVEALGPNAPGSSNIVKLLHGGELYVPLRKEFYQSAMKEAIGGFRGAVLGSILSGLHYLVIGIRRMDKELCDKVHAARWGPAPYPRDPQAEACHWILGRSNPNSLSKTMTDERVNATQDDYHVQLEDLVRNVALCHNAENNNNGGQLYTGPEKYPPCAFGLPFVDGEFELHLPLYIAAKNGSHKAEYPEWMDSIGLQDNWNDALEFVCAQESDDKPEECGRL